MSRQRRVGLFASHEEELIPRLVPLSVADTSSTMNDWRLRADALDEGPGERETSRELSFSRTFGGRRELRGSYDDAPGQVIDAALALATTTDAETETRTAKERRADALIDICQYFLDNQRTKRGGRHRPHLNLVADVETSTPACPGASSTAPPRRPRSSSRSSVTATCTGY